MIEPPSLVRLSRHARRLVRWCRHWLLMAGSGDPHLRSPARGRAAGCASTQESNRTSHSRTFTSNSASTASLLRTLHSRVCLTSLCGARARIRRNGTKRAALRVHEQHPDCPCFCVQVLSSHPAAGCLCHTSFTYKARCRKKVLALLAPTHFSLTSHSHRRDDQPSRDATPRPFDNRETS